MSGKPHKTARFPLRWQREQSRGGSSPLIRTIDPRRFNSQREEPIVPDSRAGGFTGINKGLRLSLRLWNSRLGQDRARSFDSARVQRLRERQAYRRKVQSLSALRFGPQTEPR